MAAPVKVIFLLDDERERVLFWLGRDCSDIKDNLVSVVPKIPSGIYIIHPENTDSSFEVRQQFHLPAVSVTRTSVLPSKHDVCYRFSVRWTTWGVVGRWSSGGPMDWLTSNGPGLIMSMALDTLQVVWRQTCFPVPSFKTVTRGEL